jgi:hypothetical protein
MAMSTYVTVTVQRRPEEDIHGDGTWSDHHELPGCFWAPRTSAENNDRRQAVITGRTLYAPAGSDLLPTDRVRLPDQTTWRVDGDPGPWTNPFTGWSPGVEAALEGGRLMELRSLDHRGLAGYLMGDDDLRAELRRRAQLGLAFAQARAVKRTGTQAASGHLEDVDRAGVKGDRMGVDIVFDAVNPEGDEYSAAREFGNARSRAEGNLRAAVPIVERG